MTDPARTSASSSREGLYFGVRAKTLALLLVATLAFVGVVVLVGHGLLDDIRRDLGAALARDSARQSQQRILARLGMELALSQRLAQSLSLQDWLADENGPAKRERFFREGENFRRAFESGSYFVVPRGSRTYYFADSHTAPVARASYTLVPDNLDNAWYFTTLQQPEGYWINVDRDKAIGVTNVWINVISRAPDGRILGVVGTGIDLARFLAELLGAGEKGVTTMILDRQGTIVAHPDPARMAFNLAVRIPSEKTIFRLLSEAEDAAALRAMMEEAAAGPERIPTRRMRIEGEPRLVALAHMPSLGWTVATLVDISAGEALAPRRVAEMVGVVALALLLLLLIASLGFDRLVLRPLTGLTASVRRIGNGEYGLRLSSPRRDELGELTRAFDVMSRQVRAHSDHLERMVAARTAELARANALMAETHRKLTDSIRYAGLIQSAILPDALLRERIGGRYFVLWQPRDVVGGDFYLFRADGEGCLFGVVDCAGHGVPGACMTMIAHAALEVALGGMPWDDPAALLHRIDAVARGMLPGDDRAGVVATNMDMGLAYVDLRRRRIGFAGARMALWWSDGGECRQLAGHRRGLNDRRPGRYETSYADLLPGRVFYLATDGLLDQAGGPDGFSFGQRRFAEWIAGHAALPLEAQKASLTATLDAYRGERGQRDDITVLAFRFDDLC